MTKATVILPTTGDRAPLLRHSVTSVQRQTVKELELFVIGDGLEEATRSVIRDMAATDPRIHLFDHPKHARRGEVYRHAALAEASGNIVCYLCDRDLWLPDHVATHYAQLREHDFSTTMHYYVSPEHQLYRMGSPEPWYGRVGEHSPARARSDAYQLTSVAHTLAAYRRLPHGWRTTPEGIYTDRYMWAQFMAVPDLRIYHGYRPTFLYFKRGNYPGWPVAKREPELRHWTEVLLEEKSSKELFAAADAEFLNAAAADRRAVELLRFTWLRRSLRRGLRRFGRR